MFSFRFARRMVALVCGVLIVAGCTTTSDAPQGETGSLALALVIGDGIVINEVDWQISGGEMDPMSGTIDTSAPGATASVEVYGLPPTEGEDYFAPGSYTISFAPGQQTARLLIPLVQDSRAEGDEAFVVKLNVDPEAQPVNVSPNVAVMIRDDE